MEHELSQDTAILQALTEKGKISVREVTDLLGISPSTARIRLNSLHERGLLTRTHGGAVMQKYGSKSQELTTDNSLIANIEAKTRIAQKARQTVNDDDIIAIGGGSTMLVFAKQLHDVKNLVVVTDSVLVAYELLFDRNIEVRMCGGVASSRTGGLNGVASEQFFHNIVVSKTYVSADSVNFPAGFTSLDPYTVVDRALHLCGRERYVLVDSSKFAVGPYMEQVSLFNEADFVVVDAETPPGDVEELRNHGIDVIVA